MSRKRYGINPDPPVADIDAEMRKGIGDMARSAGRQINDSLNRAADSARRAIGTSNVSSSNPTAGGGSMANYVTTGKERANHKYKGKVKTRTGKIRYVYDKDGVTTASGTHLSNKAAFDSQANARRAEASARAKAKDRALQRGREQEAAYQRQKKREADPVYQVKRAGARALNQGKRMINDARTGLEEQIKKTKRYLGKLF